MKVKDLISKLNKIDPDKQVDILVNLGDPENWQDDIFCQILEFWDNGSESINLFIGR